MHNQVMDACTPSLIFLALAGLILGLTGFGLSVGFTILFLRKGPRERVKFILPPGIIAFLVIVRSAVVLIQYLN